MPGVLQNSNKENGCATPKGLVSPTGKVGAVCVVRLGHPPPKKKNTSVAGGGSREKSGSSRKCCSLRRMVVSSTVAIFTVYFYFRVYTTVLGDFESKGSFLRGNYNSNLLDAKSESNDVGSWEELHFFQNSFQEIVQVDTEQFSCYWFSVNNLTTTNATYWECKTDCEEYMVSLLHCSLFWL